MMRHHTKETLSLYCKSSNELQQMCISCERLLQRKSVTQAKNMKGSVWNRLMSFKLLNDPSSLYNKVLHICTNCKPIIKNDNLPGRCVLNGL